MAEKKPWTDRWDKGRWLATLWGAGLGLFLGRLWTDFGPSGWPTGLLVAAALTVLCARAVPLLTWRFHLEPTPLAVGYVYALWPKVDPGLAAAVALVIALGLILAHRKWLFRLPAELFVFLVGLAVYVATLAPSVLPADSGEFQLVSRTLGIAHPPGYPLYTLLGWLFTWLPAGDPAWRVNLLSAVLAAGTLALVSRAVRRLTRSTAGGLIAALALGGAVTFWAQATSANVRSLTALFTALLLMLLIEYQGRIQEAGGQVQDGSRLLPPASCLLPPASCLLPPASCLLPLASFIFGLAVTHHGSLAFLALPAAAYVLLTTPRILTDGRLILRVAGAFAAALLVLAYLPIRGAMGAPLDPGGLTTVPGFLRHVLALGFQGDLFYFTRPVALADRLLVLGDILRIQFGLPLLALAALGLVRLTLRGPREALLLAGVFGVNAGVAITYRAPQTVEYLMPSYVALAFLVGAGAAIFDLRAPPKSQTSTVRSGDFSRSVRSGDFSRSVRSSDFSRSVRSGDFSRSVRSSDFSCSVRSSDFSCSVRSGDFSRSVRSSDFSRSSLHRRLKSSLRTQAWRRATTPVLLGALLALGAWNAWEHYPSFRALSHDHSEGAYTEDLLNAASPGALILSNWHHATAFWYLQQVEGLRPDVQVTYVNPEGAEPIGETWRRRVITAAETWPQVILTNRPLRGLRHAEFAGLPYRLAPFQGAFRLETEPVTTIPPDATSLDVTFGPAGDAGPLFRLRGIQTSEVFGDFGSLYGHFSVAPGQTIPVVLFWEPLHKVDREYSIFVHLVDDAGTVWGQQDTTPPVDAWQPGALLADQHTVTLLTHAPPGRYHLIAGLYTTRPDGGWERVPSSDGGDAVRLAEVTVLPAEQPPTSLQPLHLAFADGSSLLGVDFDHSRPEALRVYLHWRRAASASEAQVRLYGDRGLAGEGTLPATDEPGYLTTAHDLPPGVTGLRVELVANDGRLPALGPWGAPVERPRLPDPRPDQRYLIFGGEMALTDIRVSANAVDLRWTALRPLTRDYSISVQVSGAGWRAQDDGTPALGAIPTLKWIRGMQVLDRHRLVFPAEAQDRGTLSVSVYDAFTLEPLVVLDDRFLKLGQGEAAHVGP